ncbi:unnamed protein product [Protopolystoma xenopodis]|uniref:Uncharacterized protein n=1 Tax=Protopolystoma xenopodis TaxID=117903 RepID=A0A448WH94_9PLAT|nr:unnamed protein product [Protopolystoma xenopodis]
MMMRPGNNGGGAQRIQISHGISPPTADSMNPMQSGGLRLSQGRLCDGKKGGLGQVFDAQ